MAPATWKQFALAVSGVATVATVLAAATLIWMILTSPDQAAMATADGNLLDVLALAFRRIALVCLRAIGGLSAFSFQLSAFSFRQ